MQPEDWKTWWCKVLEAEGPELVQAAEDRWRADWETRLQNTRKTLGQEKSDIDFQEQQAKMEQERVERIAKISAKISANLTLTTEEMDDIGLE